MADTVEYFVPITLASKRVVAISAGEDTESVELEIDMKWADGMVGVMPMFNSLEAAKAYAGPELEIMMFEGPPLEEAKNVEKTSEAE